MRKPNLIALNEDCSHYFIARAGRELDAETVESWVDQYADTQVKTLMLNPNGMRTSYASEVWDPIWKGYDPDAGDDQPLFAGMQENPEAIASIRKWVHTAWQLNDAGIDVYAHWIERARSRGISPWISMRMNDVHNAGNEQHAVHNTFWRENPHLRRIDYMYSTWQDRAFDYGKAEVREHNMRLVRELAERYDFDGLELDWMRFGYHFAPGGEEEGIRILNEFTAGVRRLLDEWEERRGHKIRLGARVPSSPSTARALGMDAVTWAKQGLIDMLTVTPFFRTIDTDMPIELWKQLLEGTDVVLAAGFEILLAPYPDYSVKLDGSIFTCHTNSLATVMGAAASALDRGADCIYLFNYMDSQTSIDDSQNYQQLLREVGSLDSITGKDRRHVVTFTDMHAVGEPAATALPALCPADTRREFRVHIGPRPTSGAAALILGIERGTVSAESITVFVNGTPASFAGLTDLPMPHPDFPTYAFTVPVSALKRGYNMVMLIPSTEIVIGWVELSICPDGP